MRKTMHGVAAFLAATGLAFVAGSSPARAQSAAEVAQSSAVTMLSILGVAEVCGYKLDGSFVDAIASNGKALAAKANLSDAQAESTYKTIATELAKDKKTNCAMSAAAFPSYAAVEFTKATDAGRAAGIAVKPLPQAAAAVIGIAYIQQKIAANDLLNTAILLGTMVDECPIKIDEKDARNLYRAQMVQRGRADWTGAQVRELQERYEAMVKGDRKRFCNAGTEFTQQLQAVLATMD